MPQSYAHAMELTISYYLAGFILLALPSGTHQHSHLIINSSIPTGSHVFIGQTIITNCTTCGSRLLAWESEAYIVGGSNAQVSITIDGYISGAVNSGLVRLIGINIDEDQNLIQISSKFHIIVLPDYKAFTIKCRNIDLGSETNTTFQLYDKNATEIEILTNESNFCPRENLRVKCSARNSSSLIIQLSGDHFSHELQCSINDPENRSIINKTFSNNTGDGTSLLVCTALFENEHVEWNRNETSLMNISCLNTEIGVQASKIFQIPVNQYNCESTTIPAHPSMTIITGSETKKFSDYGAGAVIGGIIAAVLVVLLIILIASILQLAILLYIIYEM